MKLRNGFVSNSSTTSFLITHKGVEIKLETRDEESKSLIDFLEKAKKMGLINKYKESDY